MLGDCTQVAEHGTKGMIQDMSTFANRALKDYSDEEVLALSQKQPDAFEELVIRYEDAFLRKVRTIIYSKEDAEEVVQDTFTRIYIYAGKFERYEGAKFSSWAYTILTRLAFTRYQKLKKRNSKHVELDTEVYEHLPDTEHFLETLSVQSEVLVALASLPETTARILKLQYLEGKTQEEIAQSEGSTVSAIKTRIHRAKKLFKETFTKNTTP